MQCPQCNCTFDPARGTRGRPPIYCTSRCRRTHNRLQEKQRCTDEEDSGDEGTILGAFNVIRVFINGQSELITTPR